MQEKVSLNSHFKQKAKQCFLNLLPKLLSFIKNDFMLNLYSKVTLGISDRKLLLKSDM